jgi:hypothetical protein
MDVAFARTLLARRAAAIVVASMMSNPYQPPLGDAANERIVTAVDSEASTVSTSRTGRLVLWWLVSFAVNLIIPVLFGSEVVVEHGIWGGAFAVAGTALLGIQACRWWPGFMRRINVGAVLVAISQLMPIVQLIAGLIAISIAEKVGLARAEEGQLVQQANSELGGFVITLVTGAILLGVSLIVGSLLTLCYDKFFRSTSS